MRGARWLVTSIVALVCPACLLFTSLDGYSGGGEERPLAPDAEPDVVTGGEASAPPPDSGAEDVAVEAGLPNLLPRGTFETGCGGLGGFMAMLSSSTLAHEGTGSCNVCVAASGNTFFTLDIGLADLQPQSGDVYRARAWVRANPAAPSAAKMIIALRTPVEQDQSSTSDLTNDWQRLEILLQITTSTTKMDVYVGGDSNDAPACFLVDDFVVERIVP